MTPEAYMAYCEHNGSLSNFHFDRYLQAIRDVFPENQPYLMVYEWFKSDADAEMSKLLGYMDEPNIPAYTDSQNMRKMNKSYGSMQVALARVLNRFFRSNLHKEGRVAFFKAKGRGRHPVRWLLQNRFSYGLHYKKYQFPDDLQSELKDKYIESNRHLAEQYDLQLPDTYF